MVESKGHKLGPGGGSHRGPVQVNPSRCVGKEFTQVNEGKRRAVAVRPRFLVDAAYQVEVRASIRAEAGATEGWWDQ